MHIDYAADMQNVFLSGEFAEDVTWRYADGTTLALSALVDRAPVARAEESMGRYAEGETVLRVAVADLASPSLDDSFDLPDGTRWTVTAIEGPHEAAWVIRGQRRQLERRGQSGPR